MELTEAEPKAKKKTIEQKEQVKTETDEMQVHIILLLIGLFIDFIKVLLSEEICIFDLVNMSI